MDTNLTGLPAQIVYYGILLPIGTYEFGAITQPLSNWAPYLIIDLDPICTPSSIIHDIIEQLSSITTLLPIINSDFTNV